MFVDRKTTVGDADSGGGGGSIEIPKVTVTKSAGAQATHRATWLINCWPETGRIARILPPLLICRNLRPTMIVGSAGRTCGPLAGSLGGAVCGPTLLSS